MFDRSVFDAIPDKPGVYALYRIAGSRRKPVCAYVGMAGSSVGRAGIRTRLIQHLVEQTSTTCSRRNPAGVHIERLTHVYWWSDPRISSKVQAQAAELYVMNQEQPLLRTEAGISPQARQLAETAEFQALMQDIFKTGRGVIELPGLDGTARKVQVLERDLRALEARVEGLEGRSAGVGHQRPTRPRPGGHETKAESHDGNAKDPRA